MASIKLYTILFVVLSAITTLQYVLEQVLVSEIYALGFVVVLSLSTIKALGVAGWYMHMIDDPRAITYIAVAGVLGVLALTAGAAYSIT